jgi:chromosome segregation ATPase
MPTKRTTKKREPVSIEFLIDLIASTQASLKNFERESTDQAEALSDLNENIAIMSEMLKNLHIQKTKDTEKIVELANQLKILQTETRLLNKDDDLKEIKYTIQQLNANVSELKTIEQTKNSFNEKAPVEKKKWKPLVFLQELISGLNNLKVIVLVVLLIIILITSIFFGPDAVDIIIDVAKKLFP